MIWSDFFLFSTLPFWNGNFYFVPLCLAVYNVFLILKFKLATYEFVLCLSGDFDLGFILNAGTVKTLEKE